MNQQIMLKKPIWSAMKQLYSIALAIAQQGMSDINSPSERILARFDNRWAPKINPGSRHSLELKKKM